MAYRRRTRRVKSYRRRGRAGKLRRRGSLAKRIGFRM